MTRTRIDLDGIWDFFPDPLQRFQLQDLDIAGPPRKILVPCPWQAQFEDLRDYTGVAWYRRSFEILNNGSLHGQSISDHVRVLHFGAVDYHATVWVNGQLVGEHEGGYLPFEMPANDVLRFNGPNELVVRVIDLGNDADFSPEFAFAEVPHGKQSWYGPVGGIWQSVYLEARHRLHIARLHITPDVAQERAQVDVQLSQPAANRTALILTVTDPHGQVSRHSSVIHEGEQSCHVAVPVAQPMLWDTLHPHLYRLEAALSADKAGDPLDSHASTFGMRSISTSSDGHLMLNGRILYLRGALDQDYYPHTIYTPFSDDELDQQFAKAKHLGLNCLRTHIKITDPRYYDAADRAGFLIWTELPNWQNLTEAAKRRARETLTGMVQRDWNHPSIIIWTIINEGWGLELAVDADHRAWLAETYAYLKSLDPYRLVVGNSPCFSNFHVVTDIEDFHNYYSIPDHYRQWREWVQAFARRPPWTFAHVYENIQSWREFIRDPWNPSPRTPAPEVRRRGSEPMVVSEFGNWGLPDVAKLRECYGGQEPWWFETGIEWGDGVVYPHGVEQRFKAYHLDKVFPTLSDLAAASQRMQYTALKFQIEQIRSYPSIVGYIITEFTDVHWESNGLLDMCRNPKAFHDVMGQVNSADAIVPTDWEKVVYWEGERCEVRLGLSHFSSVDLQGSRLEWHLDLWPEIKGGFEDLRPDRGRLTYLGTVMFKVPSMNESARVRLELELFDSTGALVTRNHHELYFFPKRLAKAEATVVCAPGLARLAKKLGSVGYRLTDDLAEAEVVVVEKMTDDLRWYVQRGGRVLWLAESSDAQQTYLGSLSIARRKGRSWQGDWASSMSWIRQDHMFGDIPSGGTVDFAFADLTPEHVIVGLSPRDFAADVHAGLFVGWLHHTAALIAERPIGTGRLLISTFRLRHHRGSHPVAAIMLHDMVAFLARPSVKETPAYVGRATPPGLPQPRG
jgi:glycosyl hydrolase family 2